MRGHKLSSSAHVLPDAERPKVSQRGDPQRHPGERRLRDHGGARPPHQARGRRLEEPHLVQQGGGRQGQVSLHYRRVRRLSDLLSHVLVSTGSADEQWQSGERGSNQRQAWY